MEMAGFSNNHGGFDGDRIEYSWNIDGLWSTLWESKTPFLNRSTICNWAILHGYVRLEEGHIRGSTKWLIGNCYTPQLGYTYKRIDTMNGIGVFGRAHVSNQHGWGLTMKIWGLSNKSPINEGINQPPNWGYL